MFLCVQLNPSPYPTDKLWQSSTRGTRSNSFFKIRSACTGIIWKFYSTTTAMEITQILKNVSVLGSPENDFNTDWFLYNSKWSPVSYIHVLPLVTRAFVSYYLWDFSRDFFCTFTGTIMIRLHKSNLMTLKRPNQTTKSHIWNYKFSLIFTLLSELVG